MNGYIYKGNKVNTIAENYYRTYKKDTQYENTYSKNNANNTEAEFDSEVFQGLLRNRQYQDAVDYARDFEFNDMQEQLAFENELAAIETNGRISNAIYSKLGDDAEAIAKVQLLDCLNGRLSFEDAQIEYQQQFGGSGENGRNELIDNFIKFKKNLGSTNNETATHLSLTFSDNDEERKSDNLTWYQKLAVAFNPAALDFFTEDDAHSNIFANLTSENFLKENKLTEEELKAAGVAFEHKDGKTTIKFAKDNDYANRLILGLASNSNFYSNGFFSRRAIIKGYNENGDVINRDEFGDENGIAPKNSNFLRDDFENLGNIYVSNKMIDFEDEIDQIKDAKKIYDEYFKPISGKKQYSSTISEDVDDKIVELRGKLKAGLISSKDYQKQAEDWLTKGKLEMLNSIGSANFRMMSNINNDQETDETLRELSNDDRSKIIQRITATDPKRISTKRMISNGLIGTLVEIDAQKQNNDNLKAEDTNGDINDKTVTGKRIQVFIPGFMYEKAQQALNNSTKGKAALELNAMQDYGYEYKTKLGKSLKYDNNRGTYMLDGHDISMVEAEREMNADYLIKMGTTALTHKYLADDGKFYTKNDYHDDGYAEYDKAAKIQSVLYCEELFPGVNIRDKEGNALTPEEIITRACDVDKRNDEQYDVRKKLEYIYDVYSTMIQSAVARKR